MADAKTRLRQHLRQHLICVAEQLIVPALEDVPLVSWGHYELQSNPNAHIPVFGADRSSLWEVSFNDLDPSSTMSSYSVFQYDILCCCQFV